MTEKNHLTAHPVSLGKAVLVGAGLGLLLIAFFLVGAGKPNPDWGQLWMIKPLVIVPLAGATGGAFYYFMDHLGYQRSWKKPLVIVLSLVVYLVGLWMGVVLGLNGTMWN